MKTDAMVQAIESAGWPLCRRYLLVNFRALPVQIREKGVECSRKVRWAIGVLADGQYEPLGVWAVTKAASSEWRGALEQIRGRGVEQIDFIVSDEMTALQPVLDAAYPRAKLLSSPPKRGRTAAAGKLADQELQRYAGQSVRRHGSFADMGSATTFVARALIRGDRTGGSIAMATGSVKRAVVAQGKDSNCSTTPPSAAA